MAAPHFLMNPYPVGSAEAFAWDDGHVAGLGVRNPWSPHVPQYAAWNAGFQAGEGGR